MPTDEGLLAVVDTLEHAGGFLLALFFPQIHNNLHHIFQHHLHQSLRHGCRVVHRRGGVDFNQPWVERVVDHEVIPYQFKRISPGVDLIRCA